MIPIDAVSFLVLLVIGLGVFSFMRGTTQERGFLSEVKHLHKIKRDALKNYPEWGAALDTVCVYINHRPALVLIDYIQGALGLLYTDACIEKIDKTEIINIEEVIAEDPKEYNTIIKYGIKITLKDTRQLFAPFILYPVKLNSERLRRQGADAAQFFNMVQRLKEQ